MRMSAKHQPRLAVGGLQLGCSSGCPLGHFGGTCMIIGGICCSLRSGSCLGHHAVYVVQVDAGCDRPSIRDINLVGWP